MMKNRVYGVIGVKSIMANWNADFTGYPKTLSTGETFGSDKALKYAIKRYWDEKDEKVMYLKSFTAKEDKGVSRAVPRELSQRYEYLFNKEVAKETSYDEILKNLFSCLDIKNFGAAFAVSDNNYSITGAVQVGQGMNKYYETSPQTQDILSPFAVREKNQSTLGTKITSDEAHYIYPFTIDPNSYKDYVELGVTEGYTEEDYEKFKEGALIGATALNTNSKMGCDSELGVFVVCDEKLYLPELAQYVEFEKGGRGAKDRIILKFDELVKPFGDRVKKVEIYYNDITTDIVGDFDNAVYYNIFTKEEVK